jgi:hypothetical protein
MVIPISNPVKIGSINSPGIAQETSQPPSPKHAAHFFPKVADKVENLKYSSKSIMVTTKQEDQISHYPIIVANRMRARTSSMVFKHHLSCDFVFLFLWTLD